MEKCKYNKRRQADGAGKTELSIRKTVDTENIQGMKWKTRP